MRMWAGPLQLPHTEPLHNQPLASPVSLGVPIFQEGRAAPTTGGSGTGAGGTGGGVSPAAAAELLERVTARSPGVSPGSSGADSVRRMRASARATGARHCSYASSLNAFCTRGGEGGSAEWRPSDPAVLPLTAHAWGTSFVRNALACLDSLSAVPHCLQPVAYHETAGVGIRLQVLATDCRLGTRNAVY
jgi:hypothetical protein